MKEFSFKNAKMFRYLIPLGAFFVDEAMGSSKTIVESSKGRMSNGRNLM
jgi:allophanate hydrolase subunit 2